MQNFSNKSIIIAFREVNNKIDELWCFVKECCSKIPINIGTGVGLFKRLNTQNKWEFKSIKAGNNVSVTSTDNEVVISATGGDTSNKWDLNGNSISNTDFLGTTNDQDLVFKRNNQEIGRLTPTHIGLGLGNNYYDVNTVNIGKNITTESDVIAIGYNVDSIQNSVVIGNNSDAEGFCVVVGNNSLSAGTGVAIGYQTDSNNNGVALGYQANASTQQFALSDNILYAKWRGIPYEFPSVQGAASTVLTNNGTGVLSWQPSSTATGTVTSVGLTMPTAFSVANSPVTTTGTLAVTATGNTSQYIRGDGALGILPENSGGAGGVIYYFNGNTASSIAGSFEMSKTPDTGIPANFSKTGDGLIASFATNINDPNITEIPGGIWLFKPYLSMATNAGSPKINTQVKIFDGISYTTIATSDTFLVSNGTATSLYTFGIIIPQTTITITDRIVVEFYLSNSLGDTITLYTEDSFINSVATTIPSGIATLNGLNTTTQYLATGTTGTDFNISSTTNTHTFNIPTASATNRGLLSTSDWSTFNGKENSLGFTPEDVSNKSDSYTASSITTYTSTKAVVDGLATKEDKLLIASATASNSAVIDFTLPTGYDYFELFIEHLIPQTNATSLFLRVSTDGGATFLAGSSDYEVHRNILSGSGGTNYTPTYGLAAQIAPIGALIGNTSGRYFRCSFRIFHTSDSVNNKNITGEFAMLRSDGQPVLSNLSARVLNTSALNAIRLLMNSGNITSGTFKLYGYKS